VDSFRRGKSPSVQAPVTRWNIFGNFESRFSISQKWDYLVLPLKTSITISRNIFQTCYLQTVHMYWSEVSEVVAGEDMELLRCKTKQKTKKFHINNSCRKHNSNSLVYKNTLTANVICTCMYVYAAIQNSRLSCCRKQIPSIIRLSRDHNIHCHLRKQNKLPSMQRRRQTYSSMQNVQAKP